MIKKKRKPSSSKGVDLRIETSGSSSYHKNTSQEYIETTSDKIKLCLIKNKYLLTTGIGVVSSLGLFLAFLGVLVSIESFKNALGIKPDTWRALFELGAAISFIFFIVQTGKVIYIFVRLAPFWKKADVVDYIVEKIKTESSF